MSVNEKFIISLQGKSFVTYEGLLDLAHQRGLLSMEVDLIQVPSKENNMTAICKATALTENERFQDIGDASPNSVNSALAPHLIRMASTRAKARVLRDLTNVGMTAFEEMSFDGNGNENESYSVQKNINPPTKRQLDTLKKLSESLNHQVDYESLDRKKAASLIGKLLEEVKK